MPRYGGSDPTVWMRALRPHTYQNKPIDEGDVYLAHEDQVENIENLKFAVRDTPPKIATHPPAADADKWPTPSSTTLAGPREDD